VQRRNSGLGPAGTAAAGDRRHARGQSTRESILRTAERLYAERGIAAVSLRDIAAAAGQKNNGAVHYHFGGKDNLVREIVRFRIEAIQANSAAAYSSLVFGAEPGPVEAYVKAFVLPFGICMRDDNYYLPFLSRYISEAGGMASLMEVAASSGLDRLKTDLGKALPDYPPAAIERRWEVFGMSVIHSLALYQTAKLAGTLKLPLDRLMDDLVRYHTAGLQAPPSPA
jgi:AcrR family transcriptional regulator